MKKLLIISIFIASAVIVNAATITITSISSIKFPVVELGNCKDTKDCHVYCEKQENILKCVDFGKNNGLISAENAIKTHKFSDALKTGGPGKCTNQRTCEQYCDATSHINECLVFAEKHELIPLSQLKEAKVVAKALQDIGKLPGGCKDQKTCEEYCSIKTNYSECAEFGKKVGLFSEVAFAQMEEALKQASPENQGCFKSVMSGMMEKIKSGSFQGQNDIVLLVVQNCLPKGTQIPGGVGTSSIMDILKKIQVTGTSSNPTPNMEEMLKINKERLENLNKLTPEGTGGGNGMGL